MQRLLLSALVCLMVLHGMADDRTLTGGEYWFDDQTTQRVQVTITADGQMDFTADASALSEGLHRLNFRAQDSEGNYSPPALVVVLPLRARTDL